jgi:hypothetical protein
MVKKIIIQKYCNYASKQPTYPNEPGTKITGRKNRIILQQDDLNITA